MAIPAYLFLTDDDNKIIRGGVDIHGRENSIEVLGFDHCITLPVDDHNGNITSIRQHSTFMVEKEVDCSTPYLYQALTSGKKLRKAEVKLYNINHAGREEQYFITLMEDVRVVSITPALFDIKDTSKEKFNHMELIEFRYERISWHYLQGNLIHTDDWNHR